MTLKMIDQPHFELKHIKENVRIATFHLVLNGVQHPRQHLALVKSSINQPWSGPKWENT